MEKRAFPKDDELYRLVDTHRLSVTLHDLTCDRGVGKLRCPDTVSRRGAMPHVLLLGANGGMGRRIAALWQSEDSSVPLRLGVRRRETLGDPGPNAEVVIARLDDPASLRSAMTDAAVVINGIGPYVYDPAPLLDACAAAGAHYVDLASEPDFLAAARSWAERDRANIAVCPGASTMPGLIELSAAHLTELIGAVPVAFDVFLSMGSANRLTAGLLASLTIQLGAPLRSPEGGISYRQLRRRQLHGVGTRLFGRYPSPFDERGLSVQNQSVATRFWVGLDRSWIVHALRALSYLRPRFRDRTWTALAEKMRPLVAGANMVGGYVGGLRIEALDEARNVLAAVNYLAQREALNIPAMPSGWAARALLRDPRAGYRPLRELITFEKAAAALRSHGFEVKVDLPASR
jgi:hypothetical protein